METVASIYISGGNHSKGDLTFGCHNREWAYGFVILGLEQIV